MAGAGSEGRREFPRLERSETGAAGGWATFITFVAMAGSGALIAINIQEAASERMLRCPAVEQDQTLVPGQEPIGLDNPNTSQPEDIKIANNNGELVITTDDPANILASSAGQGPDGILAIDVNGNISNYFAYQRLLPTQNIRIAFLHANCEVPENPLSSVVNQ